MAGQKVVLSCFVSVILFSSSTYAFLDGLYCGAENCYDVLGVVRESSKADISKAYRKLARKYHPDRYKGDDAEAKFQLIATAYEVLKDEEQRADYDYMLDHPEETYGHYYRYYRRQVAPKVDVRVVIAVSITVVSLLQYLHGWSRYNEAVKYALTMPRYRKQGTAMQRAKEEGLLNHLKRGKKSKEELKEEEESILREVVESSLDIRGGYSKPRITDVLWLRIALLPYTIVCYIAWLLRWYWKFTIRKEEYGDDEKAYIMRKKLGLSCLQWDALEAPQKKEFFSRQLWIDSNFQEFKGEQEDEMRIKLAQNNKYKAYRRYMKKGGPGQMTFIEDD
ncbi:dnaJ homolog subfamily C member 25 homolog [Acropora millepora]|uniref:dnaJ homolog subfamily C member 25 homolog n=1 Tax=Acropora millepora TaxID=45264 RepID=UPI001CF4A6ED|nr:dnaJ homolog subfamily C member 25 homolog [Acropora millepora]